MAEGAETAKRIAVVAMDGSKHSDIALNFYVQNVYKENDEVIAMYCVHHKAQHKYESKWMPVDPNIIVHKYHEETAKGEARSWWEGYAIGRRGSWSHHNEQNRRTRSQSGCCRFPRSRHPQAEDFGKC
ncbi:uncharacterized protein LOC134716742 [Mytilus trossulus]|uniref:uncharacterized protein LOC134716742 n=1 Tax=Mytilus trossulus TaxID=6551 RepID=UPI003004065E